MTRGSARAAHRMESAGTAPPSLVGPTAAKIRIWREANMAVHRSYEILRWGAGTVDVTQNKSDLGCKASFDQTELVFIVPTSQKP